MCVVGEGGASGFGARAVFESPQRYIVCLARWMAKQQSEPDFFVTGLDRHVTHDGRASCFAAPKAWFLGSLHFIVAL